MGHHLTSLDLRETEQCISFSRTKKKAAYTNTNLNLILRMSEQSFKHVFLCILEVVKEHIFP